MTSDFKKIVQIIEKVGVVGSMAFSIIIAVYEIGQKSQVKHEAEIKTSQVAFHADSIANKINKKMDFMITRDSLNLIEHKMIKNNLDIINKKILTKDDIIKVFNYESFDAGKKKMIMNALLSQQR